MVIQAQLADGTILEFPDGTTDDVINNAVRQTVGAPPVLGQPPAPEQVPAPPPLGEPAAFQEEPTGFLARSAADLRGRGAELADIVEATRRGDQTFAEGVLQFGGKNIAGATLDVLGEAVRTGFEGVEAITPEAVKKELGEAGAEFLATDVGQAGLRAIESGIDAYTDFAQANPRAARNIESVVNIGALLFPVSKEAGKEAAEQTIIGRAGERVEESARRTAQQRKEDFVADLVLPEQTKKVRSEQALRTTQEGRLKTNVVQPNAQEAATIEEVAKLGVTPRQSTQANLNLVLKEVDDEATKLRRSLVRSKIIFPRRELKSAMDDTIARLVDEPSLVGDAQATAIKFANQAQKILDKNPSTPAGVLASRKEFDNLLRNTDFNPTTESGRSIAAREIRQTLNNFIADRVPNVAVKDSLRKQSNLLNAVDNMAVKAGSEGRNSIIRAWRNVVRSVPLKDEFSRQMAAILGLGAVANAGAAAPFLTGVAIGGIGLAKGRRAISQQTRRGIAKLLEGIDQGIRTTKDKQLIKELRTNRSALLELLEESGDLVEENGSNN